MPARRVPGMNTLKGKVTRRSFVGAQTDYVVDVNGTALRVISSSRDARYQPSQDVLVELCTGRLPAARELNNKLKNDRRKHMRALLQDFGWGRAVGFGGTACGAQSAIPTLDQLYQAAKAEGQVVFGGAIKEENQQKLAAVFQQRFPGIAIKYTRRSTEPMVQLVEAERRANRVSFDLLNLTEPGDVVRWTKQGFLAAVPMPDTDKMLPETFDPNGFSIALSVTPMLGIYSTKALKPGEAPTSLKDAGDRPEMEGQGRDLASDPRRHQQRRADECGQCGGARFHQERDASATSCSRSATRRRSPRWSRASGAVSWGVSGYRAIEAKAEGSPIELIVWDEGLALAQFIGVVPAKAPHPNAARLLLRWMMTPEGQELLVKNVNQYSARKDIAITPLAQPPLSALRINAFSNEKIVSEGHALAVEFDKAVGM